MSKSELGAKLESIAAELSERVRAHRMSDARDWSTLPAGSVDDELQRVALEFSSDWGTRCVRSLAEHYVRRREAAERWRAIDAAIGGIGAHLRVLADAEAAAFRTGQGRSPIPAVAGELAALLSTEAAARSATLREAQRARARIERASRPDDAVLVRLDAAFGGLPPHSKEWAYHVAFMAYDYGLGPTEVAKLEALVAHEFYDGVTTEMTATVYVPLGDDRSSEGAARTARQRWHEAFKLIGLAAPSRPRVQFSRADGRPTLG